VTSLIGGLTARGSAAAVWTTARSPPHAEAVGWKRRLGSHDPRNPMNRADENHPAGRDWAPTYAAPRVAPRRDPNRPSAVSSRLDRAGLPVALPMADPPPNGPRFSRARHYRSKS
jgi:hypothetical protein